jgi:DivIVA domain-containing protein
MAPDPSLTPELIHARAFTVGFRGYDQSEVREFLNRLSAEVRSLRDDAERMESNWRSAEERAARPPVLDEETLMAAVGEETAAILRTARASAAELRNKAGEDADRIREEAEGLLDEKTKAAEEAAEAIVVGARAEAAAMLETARAEAEQIRAKAEQDHNLTVEGANATRERILEDLSRRRRVATVQIEQLRAGRERLLESYAVVRRTLEEAQEELSRADAEARAAADEVGRRMNREQDPLQNPTPASSPTPSSGSASSAGSSAAAVAAAVDHPASGGTNEPDEHDPVPHLRVVPDPQPAAIEPGVAEPEPGEPVAGAPEVAEPATASASPVDQLFAKIRAGRGDSAGSLDKTSAPETERDEEPPASAEDIVVEPSDEAWLQKREEAVASLEVSLTRKLKRALQDEQNDLLDRLRGLRSEVTAAALLPSREQHTERYAKAARPLVDQAAAAGAAFAAGVFGSETNGAAEVAGITADAADAIVGPLRRRLEQAIQSGGSEDQAVLVESLGAAYREWKSQRVERVAGDALSAAFAGGTWNAVPAGTPLRWIVDDVDGPCPDCDDDALAGSLPKGESFPTGQPHPPAHTGCRCLLVPVAE